MWPFRPPQTAVDTPDRHAVTLDLIERVAALRGQVRAMETEWDAIRVQIQKGWQRLEKANSRAERRLEDGEGGGHGGSVPDATGDAVVSSNPVPLAGFAKKLADIRGG